MTLHALVTSGAVHAVVNRLPLSARRIDTGQWVLGLADAPKELTEACGWYEVVDTPRPATADNEVATSSIELVDGVPTRVWTVRLHTPQEAAAARFTTAQAVYDRALGLLAPDELAATQALALEAEGIADGDPWRQPQGAHDAYPVGAVVTHNGKTWTNTLAANVWAPGVTGWSEVTEGVPDWVQPAGAHDAYPAGARVMHNGQEWVSDLNGNVWEPGVYGWTAV